MSKMFADDADDKKKYRIHKTVSFLNGHERFECFRITCLCNCLTVNKRSYDTIRDFDDMNVTKNVQYSILFRLKYSFTDFCVMFKCGCIHEHDD